MLDAHMDTGYSKQSTDNNEAVGDLGVAPKMGAISHDILLLHQVVQCGTKLGKRDTVGLQFGNGMALAIRKELEYLLSGGMDGFWRGGITLVAHADITDAAVF